MTPLALPRQCAIFVEESASRPVFGRETLSVLLAPPCIVRADEDCVLLPTQLARDLQTNAFIRTCDESDLAVD